MQRVGKINSNQHIALHKATRHSGFYITAMDFRHLPQNSHYIRPLFRACNNKWRIRSWNGTFCWQMRWPSCILMGRGAIIPGPQCYQKHQAHKPVEEIARFAAEVEEPRKNVNSLVRLTVFQEQRDNTDPQGPQL
ncbi:uncharacterized protein LOC144774269 isoform X2 [Lissotriton helveticus]